MKILRLSRLIVAISLLPVLLFSAKLDSIEIVVSPPFPDTTDDIQGIGYRLLNKIHFNSRDFTVLRLNPLSLGSFVDSSSIAYAEVVLRSYPFWDDAKFIPLTPESTKWQLKIHDLWTMKVKASFRYVAERGEWSLGMEEENLLGLGAYFSAGYAHYVDRNWWRFATKFYGIPARGWDIAGYYNKIRKEWKTKMELLRPQIYNPNENLFFISARAESVSIQRFMSLAVPYDTTYRKKIGLYSEVLFKIKNKYAGIGMAVEQKTLNVEDTGYKYIIAPVIGRYSIFRNKFLQLRNLDNFSRIEDLSVGYELSLGCGYCSFWRCERFPPPTLPNRSAPFYGLPQSLVDIPEIVARMQIFARLGYNYANDKFYFGMNGGSKWILGDGESFFKIRFFVPASENSKWRFGIGLDCDLVFSGEKFFVADGRNGFRGFPLYYEVSQYKDERTFSKMTTELRYFPDFEFFTICPGFAAFMDVGAMNLGRSNAHYISDFGISIRLASTRSTTGNVNRFEFSYSPQTKKIGFTLDSGQAFSFFLPLEIAPMFKEE